MFIALVVFVPLIYIVAGFSAVQRGVFASTAAAREAGRAIGTAPDPVTGQARARAGGAAGGGGPVGRRHRRPARLRAGRARTATRPAATSPTLTPGEEFSVCVTVTVRIPLLPEFIDANTATGQFVVERDRYVDG